MQDEESVLAIIYEATFFQMTREIMFLIQRDGEKTRELARKTARKAQGAQLKAEALEKRENEPHIFYGLNGNRIMHRVNVRTI